MTIPIGTASRQSLGLPPDSHARSTTGWVMYEAQREQCYQHLVPIFSVYLFSACWLLQIIAIKQKNIHAQLMVGAVMKHLRSLDRNSSALLQNNPDWERQLMSLQDLRSEAHLTQVAIRVRGA